MLQPLDLGTDLVFAYRVNGTVTTEELKPLANSLTEKIREHGTMRVYIEYVRLDGVTPGALWEDLKFDLKHLTDFDKAAIVTDTDWVGASAQVANLIPGLDVKFFKFDQQEQARQWVKA